MRFFHKIVQAAALDALLAIACIAWGQPTRPQVTVYPVRPVRYIIPYPPGGSTDPMGRMIAARLSERWGQSVIVENRPGDH